MTISDADSRAMLDLARRAAIQPGSMVIQTPARALRASTKSSPTDFVTEMDRAAEQLILETILAARPDDGMVGEEGASKASHSGHRRRIGDWRRLRSHARRDIHRHPESRRGTE